MSSHRLTFEYMLGNLFALKTTIVNGMVQNGNKAKKTSSGLPL